LRSGISDNLLIDTFVQNSKFFCPEIGDLIYISSKLSANNIPIDFILSFMTYFVFLWFCPAHGHCYGFHVIVGSEGRKDPANSLYAYLEKAPEIVYYDFACSLSEYAKNRESGYFAKTRFFHDIFHGYSHKCSQIFKSNRLLGLNGINSSICEQFNSFIQCIKSSCKLMTQEHYTFYLQFFIKQWNNQRKESYLKKITTIIAGHK